MMDDWPSHTQELTRKTATALDVWADKYNSGLITKREFFVIVSALYDATSGLIDRDVSDLMADIHKTLISGKA